MDRQDNHPLLSVIIPVFNGETYLRDCLDSVCAQSLTDIEILIVDDGSTDASADIAREYASRDARVILCQHSQNKGLFEARLTGVRESHGGYIGFVDADDTVSIDWFRLLLQRAESTQSEITAGQFLNSFDDGRLEYFNLDPLRAPLSLEGEALFKHFIGQEGSCYSWHLVWNKLYTRSLWEAALPSLQAFSDEHPRFVMCEDIAFSASLWLRAKRFEVVTDGAFYFYRQHSSASTSHNRDREKILKNMNDASVAFDHMQGEMLTFAKQDSLTHLQAWRADYARMYYSFLKESKGFQEKRDADLARRLFQLSSETDLTVRAPQAEYFYSVCTPVDRNKLDAMEALKRQICSDSIETVSFDLFDTLVLRPFLKPTDLFYLLQEDFERLCSVSSYLLFSELRVNAEALCRKRIRASHPDFDDVTLDEIYEQLGMEYPISKAALDALKAKEIELEQRFCTPRRIGAELFSLARTQKKRVIVCSDMYLPQASVEVILSQNGFVPDALYLSSAIRQGKWTRRLFRYVQKELGCAPKNILHIGDNLTSDVEYARQCGWSSAHLPAPVELFRNGNPTFFGGGAYRLLVDSHGGTQDGQNPEWGFFGYRTALAVAVNRLWDSPFSLLSTESDFDASPYRVGYFCLGQYLYAITDWLSKKAKREGRETIHFVARDGYLPMRAYEILRLLDGDLPPANYLYISRKSMALLDVDSPLDVFSFSSKLLPENTTAKQLDRMLTPFCKEGLKPLREELGEAEYTKKAETRENFDRLLLLFTQRLDFAKIKTEKEALKNAFQAIVKPRDLLFDIGYSGRGEAILTRLLGYSVDGAYVHDNTQSLMMRSRKEGFLTECFFESKPIITGVVREHSFMKNAPSVIGYRLTDGVIEPIFEEEKENACATLFTEILQGAALDYVRDLCQIFGADRQKLLYRKTDLARAFEEYLHHAKALDRKMFSCVIFEDEMGYGKAFSALDFWERDLEVLKSTGASLDELSQDSKLRHTFMPYPRWKKALCYLILDRKHFRESFRKVIKK